jgi:hypothetical protein
MAKEIFMFYFYFSYLEGNCALIALAVNLGSQRPLLKTPCLLAMTFLPETTISQCDAEEPNEVEPLQVYRLENSLFEKGQM